MTAFSVPARDVAVYAVRYGRPSGCCTDDVAFVLRVGRRIGWVADPEALSDPTLFDLQATDDYLFSVEFRELARVAGIQLDVAVRVMLARDPDTPEDVLAAVARSLTPDRSHPAIGVALLSNPRARSSVAVLEPLVQASSGLSVLREIHDEAWSLLRALTPGLEALRFEAAILRDAEGALSGFLTIRNPTRSRIALEYAGVCHPSILVFADPSSAPVWDQLRWWNSRPGACKWLPQLHIIDPGTFGLVRPHHVTEETILGDSLPPGLYEIAIRLRVLQPRDTTLIVSAGLHELGAP